MSKLREWINKDNGNFSRIGNRKLNAKEITGYLVLIGAYVVYILHDKIGFNRVWIGWTFLVIGVFLVAIGTPKESQNK